MECFIGIDLAVRKGKCCGIAVLKDGECVARCSFSLSETLSVLMKIVEQCTKCIVAIDAPLTSCSRGFREVDRRLIEMGYRVLPPSFPGMRKLTEKAIELAEALMARGCIVIETHPRSALKSSRCSDVWTLLKRVGLESCTITCSDEWRRDIEDSLVALCVAICSEKGCAQRIDGADGSIVLLDEIC